VIKLKNGQDYLVFILVLLCLTDPCCISISFNDTTNEGGHTENNLCTVKICNSLKF